MMYGKVVGVGKNVTVFGQRIKTPRNVKLSLPSMAGIACLVPGSYTQPNMY